MVASTGEGDKRSTSTDVVRISVSALKKMFFLVHSNLFMDDVSPPFIKATQQLRSINVCINDVMLKGKIHLE